MIVMTIREAIKIYGEYRAKKWNVSYLEAINGGTVCVIIPLNSGSRIFVCIDVDADWFREKYPNELPNKNGIFKRLSFEFTFFDTDPIITKEIREQVRCWDNISCYVEAVKEKYINELINLNGDINKQEYLKDLDELFGIESLEGRN